MGPDAASPKRREMVVCPGCEGNGRNSGDTRHAPGSCSTCDGEGVVNVVTLTIPCQACAGITKHRTAVGWVTCRACNGVGIESWQHVERVES